MGNHSVSTHELTQLLPSRHVNAEFGKGSGNPTYAYTFSTGTGTTYGENYMLDAVKSLIDKAHYDVATAAKTGKPAYVNGYTQQEAVAAVVSTWQNLWSFKCPPAGQPINNPSDPNAPP